MKTARVSDDLESLRERATALTQAGKLADALAVWTQIEQAGSDDGEAAQQIVRLTIENSRRPPQPVGPARVEPRSLPAASSQLAFLDPQTAARLEKLLPSDGVNRTLVQKLEYAVREYPANPDWYLLLVPHYLEKGRDYDAERLLAKGREDTENDPRVCALWEEVAMLRMAGKIELAQQEVDQHDSEQGRAAVTQLHRDRDRLEISIFTARAEREPHNAALQLELGRRLKRAAKLAEAQRHLQSALSDPVCCSAAAFELGACHEERRQLAQALKYYRLSADSALVDQRRLRRDALQAATRLAISRKLRGAARRYLDQWEQLDPRDRELASLRRQADEQLPSLSDDRPTNEVSEPRTASSLSSAGRYACRKPL